MSKRDWLNGEVAAFLIAMTMLAAGFVFVTGLIAICVSLFPASPVLSPAMQQRQAVIETLTPEQRKGLGL